MSQRYDVVTSRKTKDGKWINTKIGAAWPHKSVENAFNVALDAAPFSAADGQAWITLFPAKERDADGSRPAKERDAPVKGDDMGGDEIPF